MSQVKTIFKNSSWLSISQVITSVCAFLWTIIIARYLGVADYGIVSFAISFNLLLGIIMDIGMSTYVTREIAKHKELVYKYTNNIFFVKLILAIILFFISGILLFLMGYSNLTILVTLVFTLEAIFISMTGYLNAVFQAFEDLKYQSIGTILNSGFLLLGILITISFNWGVLAVAVSYAIAYSIYFSFMLARYIKRFNFPKFELDLSFIKEVIINSVPFGLTNFFYNIYFSIDVVMLSYLAGDYATGLYKSAYNIINVFTTFFIVYQGVFFPVMSKFFQESRDLIKVSYELSVKYLLLLIMPISIGVFFYARPIIDLIYSNQYSLASIPMQILIWTVAFLFVNGAASILLNAVDMERIVTKIYIVAAIFNIVLNLILIPQFSYNGAAIATVLSEILITGLTLYYVFKTDYKPDFALLKNIIKIVLATIVLGIVFYFTNVSLWLAIPMGLVVYLVAIILFKSIDENDKYIINELLGK